MELVSSGHAAHVPEQNGGSAHGAGTLSISFADGGASSLVAPASSAAGHQPNVSTMDVLFRSCGMVGINPQFCFLLLKHPLGKANFVVFVFVQKKQLFLVCFRYRAGK